MNEGGKTNHDAHVQADLKASYAHCASVARRSGSNFYISFLLLPKRKCRAMVALYTFLRQTDDLADSEEPLDARREALTAWREELESALTGEPRGLVFPALMDTAQKYKIPPNILFDVLDGVEMDLEPRPFETFADLEPYCHRVASTVGLACLRIWGYHGGEEAEQLATTCGVAFQMTNILRDVKEDALRGRVYLPKEDLERFGCTEADLLDSKYPDRVRELMRFEIERAERLYQEADALKAFLFPQGRRVFGAMFSVYQRLLKEIKNRDGNVFGERVRVPLWRRLAIVSRCAIFAQSRKGQDGERLSGTNGDGPKPKQ